MVLSVYQNNVSPGNLIGTGDSSRVTIFLPAGGTYILSEADSGLAWGRINANQQRFDTQAFSPGNMAVDTFINRRYSTSIAIADKWNILSYPLIVNGSSYTTLFPDAITSPYRYVTSYQFSQYLEGDRLLVEIHRAAIVTYASLDSLVIDTRVGWNLIGTVASPVLASDIVHASGIVYTPYFRYTTIYSAADTLFRASVLGQDFWAEILSSVPARRTNFSCLARERFQNADERVENRRRRGCRANALYQRTRNPGGILIRNAPAPAGGATGRTFCLRPDRGEI
jgi:hypothetical protein